MKGLQVVDVDRDVMHLRGLMSSSNASINFDLRCEVREKVLAWMQENHPDALPRTRGEIELRSAPTGADVTSPPGTAGPSGS